jgi:hypothetical protein
MKVMIVWRSHPGTHAAALEKFMHERGVRQTPGIKILFSVHGIGSGFILLETEDYGNVANFCNEWQKFVSMEANIVIDDAQLVRHHTHLQDVK